MKYSLILLITIFVVLGVSNTHPMEKGIFQPPSLQKYKLDSVKELDKDEVKDGIKETKLEIYKNIYGQFIGKYICNGKTWAWGVKANNNDDDTVNNYTIRDSNGDGIFDERYGGNETTYVPSYCK